MPHAHLEVSCSAQEQHKHGDRIKIDFTVTSNHSPAGRDERGPDSETDRQVHAGSPCPQAANSAREKGPRRIGDDRHAHQQTQEPEELLDLRVSSGAQCADVMTRTKSKVAEIEARIEELTTVKRALEALIVECQGKGPLSHCTILDALESEDE